MSDRLTYVICCTEGQGPGIHACHYDEESGNLSITSAVEEGVANPFYGVIDPTGRCLYVVDHCKQCGGVDGGAVSAYRIHGPDGDLSLINTQPVGGECPCYIAMSNNGRFVLTACYVSGSVTCLPVKEDGSLGAAEGVVHDVPAGREAAHAHSIILSPDNRFALAADLGIDRVLTYQFDSEGNGLAREDLGHVQAAEGSGPRHVVFHPNGRRVYCQTEYDNTMIAFDYDAASGSLQVIGAWPTLPEDFSDVSYGSDVHIHPNGRFVYGSNRGHDSIALFEIDEASGRLDSRGQTLTGGKFPRGFAIDPAGRHLLVANQNSDEIVVFAIDAASGALTRTADVANIHKPCCFVFAPSL